MFALGVLLPQGSHTPTEVVPEHHQPGRRHVSTPFLGKRVDLASLAGVEVALRPIPSLQMADIDGVLALTVRQRLVVTPAPIRSRASL